MNNRIREQMHRLIQEKDFHTLHDKSLEMIKENPSDYEGYWWRGISLTLIGRYPEAIKVLHEALKHADSEDEESKIMSSLAKVFILQKKFEKARDYTLVSLELNPRNNEAILMRSITYAATGRKNESQKLLEKNLSKFDHYELAAAYALMKNKQQMLESLRKSFEEEPYRKTTVLYDPEFKHVLIDHDMKKLLNLS